MAVVMFALALVMLAGRVLLLFWRPTARTRRPSCLLLFLAGGGLAWRIALARLTTPPGAFSLSVAELARDRSAIAAAAGEPRQP